MAEVKGTRTVFAGDSVTGRTEYSGLTSILSSRELLRDQEEKCDQLASNLYCNEKL